LQPAAGRGSADDPSAASVAVGAHGRRRAARERRVRVRRRASVVAQTGECDMTTEARLDSIRRQALQHGAVDAAGVRPAGAPFPQATPETGYYGLPLLKPPTWTWEVPAYFFVGGASGASAVIGAIASNPALARDARWIAAAGGIASSGLLTADLGRPARF